MSRDKVHYDSWSIWQHNPVQGFLRAAILKTIKALETIRWWLDNVEVKINCIKLFLQILNT